MGQDETTAATATMTDMTATDDEIALMRKVAAGGQTFGTLTTLECVRVDQLEERGLLKVGREPGLAVSTTRKGREVLEGTEAAVG